MFSFLLFFWGIFLLILGSFIFVECVVRLAPLLKVSVFFLSLTLVSIGTSLPELVVTLTAKNEGEIVLGTILGSNIFNILFILGLTCLIFPFKASNKKDFFDPIIVIVSATFSWICSFYDFFPPFYGLVSVLCFCLYLRSSLLKSEKEISFSLEKAVSLIEKISIVGFFIFSLLILYYGGGVTVSTLKFISQSLGKSYFILSSILISVSTSLPEVITVIVACIRKQKAIVLGNILGSNIFNIWGILGLTSFFAKHSLLTGDMATKYYFPFSVLCSVVIFSAKFMGKAISRCIGFVMLCSYFLFTFIIFEVKIEKQYFYFNVLFFLFCLVIYSSFLLSLFSKKIKGENNKCFPE